MTHIGVPKETKPAEMRVALTPVDAGSLVKAGHTVWIESGAGVGAGFGNEDYTDAGCKICADADALYAMADMVVKVKEPQQGDVDRLTQDHLLFCYLHLAAEPKLTEDLKNIGLTAVAFETLVEDGKTPLLAPMSAIAGRLATQNGTSFLHSSKGGRGVLMGGISTQSAGHVVVIGAGIAGQEAAILAAGMGAHVTLLDLNEERLNEVQAKYPAIHTRLSNTEAIDELLPTCDLLVGAVYVIGRKAPTVVSEDQVKLMPKGSVIVDISIDQGGCIATSRPTSHDEPYYEQHGVIHSAITNMPAAAQLTASEALSRAITPYVLKLANDHWSKSLKEAINVKNGQLMIDIAKAS